MSAPSAPSELSKRERQVMEVISRLGRATGRDIERELPNAPTYSAVRSILRILTNKGLLTKEPDGEGRDWYAPAVPIAKMRRTVIRDFVKSFFADSAAEAACALLGQKNVKLSAEEAERLMALIKEARKQ